MDLEVIISIVTVLVSFILGLISKRISWVSNHLIPLQNLVIGIIAAIIYYIVTKDINLVIAGLGLFTGGVYDIGNNLKKLLEE